MSFVVIIPARYASTRLPGKPLVDINGKPMIVHVLERARESGAGRVIVATDHPDVARAVEAAGGEVCMTRADHQSGTERLAEVVEKCGFSDETVIVNVQGDEPMIPAAIIRQVADNLARRQVGMATLAVPIHHATSPGHQARWSILKCSNSFACCGTARKFTLRLPRKSPAPAWIPLKISSAYASKCVNSLASPRLGGCSPARRFSFSFSLLISTG